MNILSICICIPVMVMYLYWIRIYIYPWRMCLFARLWQFCLNAIRIYSTPVKVITYPWFMQLVCRNWDLAMQVRYLTLTHSESIANSKRTTARSSVSQALLAIHFRYPLPLRYRPNVHPNQPFPVNQALKYTDRDLLQLILHSITSSLRCFYCHIKRHQ